MENRASCPPYQRFLFSVLIALSGLLFTPEAHAAISFVQQKASHFSGSGGTVSFNASTTAGDLVIVGFYFGPSVLPASVADSQGNIYQQIGSALASPSGKQSSALYYARNIKGGSDSVTVTLNGVPADPGLAIYIFEYRGVDKVSPLDGNAQARGSASSVSSGTFNTTASGDLLFGFCISDSSCTKGTGFTARSTFESNLGEEKILSSPGLSSATATANASWTMQAAAFKPAGLDTTPPSIPTDLVASVISSSQINLSWSASTDNIGVAGYYVFRNGSQIAQGSATSYSNIGLTPSTTYSYTVAAYDAAGNVSGQTMAVSATTLADTTPPSIPTGLTASVVSTSQINLSWSPSTDNAGVAGYYVFRDGSQIAQVSGTSYSNTGLTPSTTYSYTVAAYDAAGNVSDQSLRVNATTQTPDTVPPLISMTAPTNGSTVSGTIPVSADASDGVGVSGVQFLLDGANLGAEDTSFPYSISWDSTAVADGAHTLSARARDAAGNQTTATPVSVTTNNPVGSANAFSIDPAPALKFGVHEVVLTGNGSVTNPFDTVATVTFTAPSAAATTVRAFYDGGNTWRARAYITETGTWQWVSTSASDPGLNGRSGSFAAFNSNLPGILKKDATNPRAWRTDSGLWFVSISDVAWMLFGKASNSVQYWQQYVQDDVARGINVMGPVGALGSDGTDSLPIYGNSNNDPWLSSDLTRYDLSKFQTAEGRLEWIFTNYPDIYVQLLLFGTEQQSAWAGYSQTVRNNTMDYMIARWSAFPNVYWLISQDQEKTSSATLSFNREVGHYFENHEPWKHLLSTEFHSTEGFPLTTADDLTWLDYIVIQDGNGPDAQQMQPYNAIPLQVQLGEDVYEQFWIRYDDPRFYFRWGMWSWILSGGAYNYGGRWETTHPYSLTGSSSLYYLDSASNINWTGQQLHGLDSNANIWPYFRNRNIDLSLFKPNNKLITAWAMRNGDVWSPKLMQRGTQEFLVYDPNAYSEGQWSNVDTQQTASFTLDLTTANGTFQVEWYRPYDGVAQNAGTVSGGAPRVFIAPWTGYDVVLRLTITAP